MNYQVNHLSKKVYEGRNQGMLLAVKESKDFKSDEWLTFLQAKECGLKIIKGAKSVSIFKGFKEFTEEKKTGDKIKTVSVSRPVGFANVFNLDQTEKIK